jgi:hypothetical protein
MFTWRKSSHSGGEGDCVEVGWRTSSYSGNETDCVEVAVASTVGVRDTKARHLGQLSVSRAAWEAFRAEISVVQPAREHRG